jgi:hypothetical protein
MNRWRNDSLSAEVIFDYLGTPVSGSSARWAVVQREANRCIIRDRQFEGSMLGETASGWFPSPSGRS